MNSIQPGRRGRRLGRHTAALACAVATALAGGLAGGTGVAHAGTYPMYGCDVPGVHLPTPTSGAWTALDLSGQVQIYEGCPHDPHGQWTFTLNYPTGVLAQQAEVGVVLNIPETGPQSAISISRVIDWSATALTAQSAGQAPATSYTLAPSISVPPGGDATGFDGTGTSGLGHDSGPLPAGTKTHRLSVFCAYYGGAYGHCTLPSPFLRVRGIKTFLYEGVQPSGSIDGGSATFGGPLKGSRTLAYTASDDEAGVEKVEVTLDGAVVATESFARDLTLPVAAQTGLCKYVALRACPATHSGVLTIDTTRVPDGAYELGLRVTDAAGNTRTTLAGGPVVIDNVPDTVPPAPPTPGPGPTGATGPAGPSGPAGPAGADGAGVVLHLNGANAHAGASLNATFTATGRGVVRSAYGKKVLITGRVLAPSGRPVTGARVSVLQQDKTAGARMAPVGDVVTDRNGRFVYVTTAVRSRTIRFGYRAHLEDTAFAQTTDISLGVVAKLTLAASPKSLRNGQAVMFRGAVAGAPRNVRKVIELQVRKGSRWMTFRSTRLRNGRFSERYRFTRTHGRVTYAFRARVRAEVGFPFLTSHSRTVKVAVRG